MTELELTMAEAISKFDKDSKGYLTYKEFERLIASLGVKLNPAQISEVIRGVDADGDGFIEIKVNLALYEFINACNIMMKIYYYICINLHCMVLYYILSCLVTVGVE